MTVDHAKTSRTVSIVIFSPFLGLDPSIERRRSLSPAKGAVFAKKELSLFSLLLHLGDWNSHNERNDESRMTRGPRRKGGKEFVVGFPRTSNLEFICPIPQDFVLPRQPLNEPLPMDTLRRQQLLQSRRHSRQDRLFNRSPFTLIRYAQIDDQNAEQA
jgi:hypothetical protein